MTTPARQRRRRQAPAPDQPPAIVSGRYLSVSFGRDRSGTTFRLTFGRVGETRAAEGRPRRRARSQGETATPSGRPQRRDAKTTSNAPRRPERSKAREAVRLATAPGRLLKRAWTAVRRRVTPGKKFDARAWTEIKKFSLIGWAGLAPGLASLGTTLATRDAVQGFVAGSIVQAANSPIQGLLSAMLERRLGNKGQSLDMQQNQQIKALTGRVNSLQKQNAELTQRLDDLVQRLDMRGPGPGGGQGPGGGPGQGPGSGPGQGPGSGPGGGPGSRARSKEESRSEGRGRGGPAKGSAKSGNGRTGSGKSERPTAPKPKREPRSR